MVLKKGLINLSESFARFGNIKNITANRYPFSENGSLQINIAGELIPEQNRQSKYQQNQQQYSNAAILNYGNKPYIEYVDNVFTTMDVVEEFLQHKVSSNSYNRATLIARDQAKILLISKSSMANGIIPFGILAFFIPFFWIGLPFAVLQIYKRRYEAEQDRFVCYSGILSTKRVSVLFARIDNINIREGMWNKVFKTATILLETIGSVTPEMTLENIPNHQEVYALLKEEYKKKSLN
jgi:membrane protein YdbS with pleckstrin-like domain